MILLHFLKLCPKKTKKVLVKQRWKSLPKAADSLFVSFSFSWDWVLHEESERHLHCLRASLFFHLCRDLSVSHGKTGKAGWVCVQTRVLPSSPSCLCAPHLHSDSWGQYCFWQTLGSSWHRTCWKQELVITINPLLQSFVFKPFKLSCNLHSNIPHCWWTFRNEPSQVRVLRLWVYFRFVLGILSVTKGFPSTAG